ncbi:hypothetical protein GX50_07286 [[Emmonsia] crescens]|uniref:G domain-containing protein n=1 Tax=[Emmonsia] crescens TaxID=73230 RepID=A0A2B7Z996_9EURO|nr:hypothetical protein GX50_07286 [Emmonsia crescens]
MSLTDSRDPPPPPYSFVGSSRLSPLSSGRQSPPPYQHRPSLSQGGLSQGHSSQLFPNSPPSGALGNRRPPRQPQLIPYRDRNLGQNENTNWGPRQIQEVELRQDDIVVPIMGLTGAGKSTFISLLADSQGVPIRHSLKGRTKDVEMYSYQIDRKTRVILVDIPSFNTTSRSNILTLRSIANFLCRIHSTNIKMAGIIYLHDITARRMDDPALYNLHMLKKLCGARGLSSVIMTTNMWGNLGTFDEGASREKQLRDRYWRSILGHGSMMMRHNGSKQSAEEIVKALLLRKQQSIVLDIQWEMVVHRQQLGDTAAGRQLYAEIREEREQYASELAALRQEVDAAVWRNNFEYEQMLKEKKVQLYKKIKIMEESRTVLRGDFQRLKGEVREKEAGKKKYFGRTALGIGVGTIIGLTTGIFI